MSNIGEVGGGGGGGGADPHPQSEYLGGCTPTPPGSYAPEYMYGAV